MRGPYSTAMVQMEEPATNGHHPTLTLEDLEERGPLPPPPSPMMLGLLAGDQEHLRHPNMQMLTEMVQRLATHMEEDEDDETPLDLSRSPISSIESDQPETPPDPSSDSHARIPERGEHATDIANGTTETTENPPEEGRTGQHEAPGILAASPLGPDPFWTAHQALLNILHQINDNADFLGLMEVEVSHHSPSPGPSLPANGSSTNAGSVNMCDSNSAATTIPHATQVETHQLTQLPETEHASEPTGRASLSTVSPTTALTITSPSDHGRTRLVEVEGPGEIVEPSVTQESAYPEGSSPHSLTTHAEHHYGIHPVGQSVAAQMEPVTEAPAIAGTLNQHRSGPLSLRLNRAPGAEETSRSDRRGVETAATGLAHVEPLSINRRTSVPSDTGSAPGEAVTESQSGSPAAAPLPSIPDMSARPVSHDHALQAWLVRQQLIAGIPVDRLEPMMGPRSRQTQVTTEGILTRFRIPPLVAITRDGTRIPRIPAARFDGRIEPLPALPWLPHGNSDGGTDDASTAPHVPSSEPINAPFSAPRPNDPDSRIRADDDNNGSSRDAASTPAAPATYSSELSTGPSQSTQADAESNVSVEERGYDLYGGDGAGDMARPSKEKGKQWAREPETYPGHWVPTAQACIEWGMAIPVQASTTTSTGPAEAESHGLTSTSESTPQIPPPRTSKEKGKQWVREPQDGTHRPIPAWHMPSSRDEQGENQHNQEQADVHNETSTAQQTSDSDIPRPVRRDLGTYFQLLDREQQLYQVRMELLRYFKAFPIGSLPHTGKRLYTRVSGANASQHSGPGTSSEETLMSVHPASKRREPVALASDPATPGIGAENRAQNVQMAFVEAEIAPGDVESSGHPDWALSWGDTSISQETEPVSPDASTHVRRHTEFSLGKALGRTPVLFGEITDHLELSDLETLMLVNRRFNCLVLRLMDRIRMHQVELDAAMSIAARIFPWTCHREYNRGCPLFWSAADENTFTYRSVPRIRWFKMIRHTTAVAQEIFGFLDSEERPWPQRTFRVILKIWLLMQLPDNGRRLWLVRHDGLWPNKDLQMAALIISNLTQLIEQKESLWGQICSLPRLMFAQKSMSVLRDFLHEDGPKIEAQVLQLVFRYCVPRELSNLVFGVSPQRVEEFAWEWFGKYDHHPEEYRHIQTVIAAEIGDSSYDGTIKRRIHPEHIIYQELNRREYEISTPMSFTEVEADTPGDELDWTWQIVRLIHSRVKFAAPKA